LEEGKRKEEVVKKGKYRRGVIGKYLRSLSHGGEGRTVPKRT